MRFITLPNDNFPSDHLIQFAKTPILQSELLSELMRIGEGLVQMLGESLCECVIHDFSRPDHSIIWIRGNVTHRTVGGTMSQTGFEMLSEGEVVNDRVNYMMRTRDGKVLKSSTFALRDGDGHAFGCFCVNLDITNLTIMAQILNGIVSQDLNRVFDNVHFTNNATEVAQTLLDEVVKDTGLVAPPQSVDQRLDLMKALDKRGMFGIRNSIPLLAEYLGLSRTSVYNYLKDVRTQSEETD